MKSLSVVWLLLINFLGFMGFSSGLTTRESRVWPISNSSHVDLPQSSAFGPRLKASSGFRYDFHRGIDIPTPLNTVLVAIADGYVRINGSHPAYSDGVVQIVHSDWDEADAPKYYSTYLHVASCLVEKGRITKGAPIALSGASASGFPHLHFEVRKSYYQRDAMNPWKFLPGSPALFDSVNVSDPNLPSGGSNGEIAFTMAVAANDLVFDGFQVSFDNLDTTGLTSPSWGFRFQSANHAQRTVSLMDDPIQDGVMIEPHKFSSRDETAHYTFRLLNRRIPEGAQTMIITAFDAWGNTAQFPFPA